ncbi:hypothetical protein PT974_02499 [Cladobotryum mycophilum]|uniref:Uncharacterized protein n=1 Tax=Cladobotryum mycophilum TaxID=491253 RepID=A0ABR0SZI8_9HYPO
MLQSRKVPRGVRIAKTLPNATFGRAVSCREAIRVHAQAASNEAEAVVVMAPEPAEQWTAALDAEQSALFANDDAIGVAVCYPKLKMCELKLGDRFRNRFVGGLLYLVAMSLPLGEDNVSAPSNRR